MKYRRNKIKDHKAKTFSRSDVKYANKTYTVKASPRRHTATLTRIETKL